MGKRSSIQQIVMRKLDIHMENSEDGSYLTPYTKINSKWIKDLNIRLETIKLLGENRGKSSWHWNGQWLRGYDIKSTSNKSKNRHRDYIKLKNFFVAKATIHRVKRQTTEWMKIFANHILDKRLISTTYKNLYNLVTINKQFKNRQRTWIDSSPKIYNNQRYTEPTSI